MVISTRGRYALRLMIDIAKQADGGDVPVSMRSAAQRQDLSVKYLEQLGGLLVRSNLLKSVRGVNGGYFLARPAEEITAGDILRAAEGEKCASVACLAENAEPCEHRNECEVVEFWRGLDDVINEYVDGVTLRDFIR